MKHLTIIFLAFLISCSPAPQKKSYTIMISFDGFRHDYVERFDLKNFKAFIKNGVAAERLIPSFPSKTFPNHYTLVTGLYPAHHGIVSNQFYDPQRKRSYNMHDSSAVTDSSFYHGTPQWKLAESNGLKAASLFWVGSEAPPHPTYFFPYDENFENQKRVEQVIRWLQLPEEQRPHFITLYFSLVDTQSHEFGPLSSENKKAAEEADELLGQLMAGLKELSLDVNVVITSDHGMYAMREERSTFIVLSDLISTNDTTIRVVNSGTQAQFYCSSCDSLYTKLKSLEHDYHFQILKQNEFPERWHYNSELVGDFLMVADTGKYIITSGNSLENMVNASSKTFGVHGYDPEITQDMCGIFYAAGPNVRSGVTLPPLKNVDVYPFVAALLDLKTPACDGSIESTKAILK